MKFVFGLGKNTSEKNTNQFADCKILSARLVHPVYIGFHLLSG